MTRGRTDRQTQRQAWRVIRLRGQPHNNGAFTTYDPYRLKAELCVWHEINETDTGNSASIRCRYTATAAAEIDQLCLQAYGRASRSARLISGTDAEHQRHSGCSWTRMYGRIHRFQSAVSEWVGSLLAYAERANCYQIFHQLQALHVIGVVIRWQLLQLETIASPQPSQTRSRDSRKSD